MAFCNSCGATLDGGAKFCNKCGATQPGAAAGAPVFPPATPAPGAPQKSGGALKIILIVVAVIVVFGILAIGAFSFFAYRIARHSRVHNENGNVRVETPFGTVNTTTDPNEAARNLGIDSYPGAEVVKGTTSDMTMGNMHTASADFETSDPGQHGCRVLQIESPERQCGLVNRRPLRHHFHRQEKHAHHQHRAEERPDQNSHLQNLRQDGRRRFGKLSTVVDGGRASRPSCVWGGHSCPPLLNLVVNADSLIVATIECS